MKQIIPCPHCQRNLTIGEQQAGKRLACPHCHGAILAPEPDPPEAISIDELPEATPADEEPDALDFLKPASRNVGKPIPVAKYLATDAPDIPLFLPNTPPSLPPNEQDAGFDIASLTAKPAPSPDLPLPLPPPEAESDTPPSLPPDEQDAGVGVASLTAKPTPSPDLPPPLRPEADPDLPLSLPSEVDSDLPLPLPPDEQDAGFDVACLAAKSPASSAKSSISPYLHKKKDKAKVLFGSLASRGKAAGMLIAKQAERTKLLKVTLPGHFHALGKHLHSVGAYRDEFPDPFSTIDALLGQIKSVEARSASVPKAEGFAAKATAAAKATQDMVQVKAIKMKLAAALAELGQAAYDSHGEESGPEDLIRPIANAKSRAVQLATEIAQLSKAPAGQVLTPKRIAIGAVALVGLILLVIIANLSGGQGAKGSKSSHGGNGGDAASKSHGNAGNSDRYYQKGYDEGVGIAQTRIEGIRASGEIARKGLINSCRESLSMWEENIEKFQSAPGCPAARQLQGQYDGFKTTLIKSGVLTE